MHTTSSRVHEIVGAVALLVLAPRAARADERIVPEATAPTFEPTAESEAPVLRVRPDHQGFMLTLSTGVLAGGNAGVSLDATGQGLYHHGFLRVGGTGEIDGGLMVVGNGLRYGEGALLGAGIRQGWIALDFLAEAGAFQYMGA